MESKNGIEKSGMPVERARPTLDKERFDVVVIGGGINGAAIARQCARAGKRVLVVEKNDFSSGTTSRATRIIHGGLRYLEHGEIGLVRESLREREYLLREKGHLVRPLNFLLALPAGGQRSALEVRFGLWLYRRFSNRRVSLDVNEERRRVESLLDRGEKWSVFAYEDAQCEYPERLVVEWLVDAAQSGAAVRNYTEALEVSVANGKVRGVRLRDRLSQDEFFVTCEWVINATGPWADSVCSRSGITTDEPLIGGVRGSHILLPSFPEAPRAAIYTEAADARPFFIVPWAGQLLVGTTEVKDTNSPDDVAPDASEVEYLLRSFNRIFPSLHYGPEHIRAAFAGVRPLPFVSDKSPQSITRRHFIADHKNDSAAGMLSIIGGKLTTAASLAREVARAIGIKVAEPVGYAVIPSQVSVALNQRTRTFASDSREILRLATQDARLAEAICPHTEHTLAEAVYAFRNEFAMTLADVLLRRVPVALGACWSEECLRVAAERIGKTLGWDAKRVGLERERFEEEYRHFLRKPSANKSPADEGARTTQASTPPPAASYRRK